MLVLSRRERQRVRLGDSIVITVVRVGGDKVRLGIEAPSDVLVLRDELEPDKGKSQLTRHQNREPVAADPPQRAIATRTWTKKG